MSDQITYNPGAVSDFASDVGSRAGGATSGFLTVIGVEQLLERRMG